MESSSSRLGLALVTLAIGGVIGYFIGHGKSGDTGGTNLCDTPQTQHIPVTPSNGGVACVDAHISASAGDQVLWTTSPGYYPWIRFKDTNAFPSPSIANGVAMSGQPNPAITPPVTRPYVVNVLRTGVPTPGPGTPTPTPQNSNARIIIDR